MNRTNWKFSYTAERLLRAAQEKQSHHSGRLAWWQAKRDQTTAAIRAEGISIDESLADVTSNSYSRVPTVQVRADLMRDLTECNTKMIEHRQKVLEYGAWSEVLGSQGQTHLDLHHDDWLFFFGT